MDSPLNFVIDTLNEQVRLELIKLRVDDDGVSLKQVEIIENNNGGYHYLDTGRDIQFFVKKNYCNPGTPQNDTITATTDNIVLVTYGRIILERIWAVAGLLDKETVSTFPGVKSRSSAILISMGIEFNTISENLNNKERIALNFLEFWEKQIIRYFNKSHRLRDIITSTDVWTNEVATRRLSVIIRA